MARRRGQRTGYLRSEGGSWLLTYRVYVWSAEQHRTIPQRLTVSIGPATGPGKLTHKQAERFAWDHYLAPLDNATTKPFSTLTLKEFWEAKYLPHLERKRKYATRSQYRSLWAHWIEPTLGAIRLWELRAEDVDKTVMAVITAGRSTETAGHVQKVVSAILEHARRLGMFAGDNPAHLVELPENRIVRRPQALTPDQARALLSALPDTQQRPLYPMVLFSLCCSLNVSELLGLCWCHLNLTDQPALVDGEALEPHSAAIREHVYHGRRGSLKTGSRKRDVPLPTVLVEALTRHRARSKFTSPADPVFAGAKGAPLGDRNLSRRGLDPVAEALGMPWVSWHVFRHSHATFTHALGMFEADRKLLMGHADRSTTDRYTHADRARLRAGVELLAEQITGEVSESSGRVN